MSGLRILVAERREFSPKAADMLRGMGELVLADLDRESLLEAVREANVLWVRLRNRIDAEVMAAAPHLKIIVAHSTGLNHIDLAKAERRSIKVVSLKGEADFLKEIRATAELAVGLLLNVARHIPSASSHASAGGWNRDLFKGNELYGKTAGIIGYGRLGRIVAHYLKAFDMRVLITDPYVDASDVETGLTFVSLDELLHESDVVSLHVNYSPQTIGFFGRAQFDAMKPGAWFINTARGELVDESALLDALHSGHVAAAGLDVVCGESPVGMSEHPLIRYAHEHDNLTITPHIGGCTVESMEKTEVFLAEKLSIALKEVCR